MASEGSEKDGSKIPWKVVGIIYAIVMSEGLAAEMISPFIADMCKTRFGISEANSGIAIGMLIGAYYLAQFCSSIFIGYLSDRVGRRIPLTIGLTSTCICSFIFALSPNYAFAIIVRIILGLTNSNFAVARAALCDAAVGKARTLALSFLGSLYQLSRAVATAASGFLAGHVITDKIEFFNNPYLLPCIVGSSCVLTTLIASFFLFPDTYKKSKVTTTDDRGIIKGLKFIMRDRLLRKLFFLHVVHSFCNGSALMMLITYFSLDKADMGLGYGTFEIGMCFAALGIAGFLFQITCFKRIVERLRLNKTYSVGAVSSAISTMIAPFSGLFFYFGGESTSMVVFTWIVSLLASASTGTSLMLGLSVLGTMLANATDPKIQGLTQGANQSFSSLLRSIGPMTSGLLFSLAVNIRFPFVPFIFLALLYTINFIVSRTITEEDMRRIEKLPLPADNVVVSDSSQVEMASLSPSSQTDEAVSILNNESTEEELDPVTISGDGALSPGDSISLTSDSTDEYRRVSLDSSGSFEDSVDALKSALDK